MPTPRPILSLAMPTPLRASFDYLPPADLSEAQCRQLLPGSRIKAPFGHRQLVGILLAVKEHSELAPDKLKAAIEILDEQPVLPAKLLSLCLWAANYYQHSVGDVLANALPTKLRKGEALISRDHSRWRLSTEGLGLPEQGLKRAPKQAKLLALLQRQSSINDEQLQEAGLSKTTLKAMTDKGLIEGYSADASDAQTGPLLRATPLSLNCEQQVAVDAVSSQAGYQCFLLEGITGSGKTEVYLQLIERCLQQGQQALLLIPEIGLTPQTLLRVKQRFHWPVVMLHSGLTDRERLLAWQSATKGEARMVIGTRSAVFTPLPELGLIIIDEEHDGAFKQQDGFRYNARDIAIKRAADVQCPIVLGSATPSLESFHNALQGRYQHLRLNLRATGASTPAFELLDIRHAPMQAGFSPELINAISSEITRGNQVLVFINRRGFAPMMMCHDCGHVSQCSHCDARMTVHMQRRQLRCHHCDSQTPLPRYCPDCHSSQLDFKGVGTERSELTLQGLFPDTRIIRIDRDSTSRKQAMQTLVEEVQQGQPCILVGTQMLAKGHHFPDVTLVAVLDADGGLFSSDFRGPEKMGQLLVQVAGRAGRESKPGRVIIQTHQPQHPLINSLIHNSYHQYAKEILEERRASALPPFSHLALIRAEAGDLAQAEDLLAEIRRQLEAQNLGQGLRQGLGENVGINSAQISGASTVKMFGPLPAPMAKRAGRYRAQLLLQAQQRGPLHRYLQTICQLTERLPLAKKVRWSIDVDPADML